MFKCRSAAFRSQNTIHDLSRDPLGEVLAKALNRTRLVALNLSITGRTPAMTAMSRIKEHMEVIGADGVHVGTVDRVESNRIKLTKADSGEGRHKGHHHYIDGSLVADVEGNKVRLSANGDVAVTMEQEA